MTADGDKKYLRGLVDELRKLPAETPWVEFKHNNAKPEDIGEYLSALSNAAALEGKTSAYVVWGIEDKTNDVVGTTFNPGEAKRPGNTSSTSSTAGFSAGSPMRANCTFSLPHVVACGPAQSSSTCSIWARISEALRFPRKLVPASHIGQPTAQPSWVDTTTTIFSARGTDGSTAPTHSTMEASSRRSRTR